MFLYLSDIVKVSAAEDDLSSTATPQIHIEIQFRLVPEQRE
jgi:hypothetical protein